MKYETERELELRNGRVVLLADTLEVKNPWLSLG